MKPSTPATRRLLPATALTLCLLAAHQSQAVTVFQDTYNYTTGAPGDQTALGTNLAARQAGGLVTSAYTEQLAGAGTRDALMTNINGASQLRFQTTNQGGTTPSQMAVDLNTNFASSLVGEHYKISLTDLAFVRGAAATLPSDIWFSIAIGDTSPSIDGPNNANADVAALIRADGSVTKWEDNSSAQGAQSSGLTVNYSFATRYAIAELHIDEATDTAWAYFEDMDGGSFTSTPWNIDFENDTNRFIELRGHQGATGTDGTDVSFYVNSMNIIIVPEPAAALLGSLGLLALLRRRRN